MFPQTKAQQMILRMFYESYSKLLKYKSCWRLITFCFFKVYVLVLLVVLEPTFAFESLRAKLTLKFVQLVAGSRVDLAG